MGQLLQSVGRAEVNCLLKVKRLKVTWIDYWVFLGDAGDEHLEISSLTNDYPRYLTKWDGTLSNLVRALTRSP